jgi:hypothetical protein
MLRRITYTVGWLTMVVPTQVRGCANVGSLTALDVPTQSERRSAKIEATSERGSPDSGRTRSSSAANSHYIGSLRTWSTQRGISDTAGHTFSRSQPSAAPLQEQETATLAATANWPSNLQSACHSDVDGAGRGHSSTSGSRHIGGGRATSICDRIATIARPSIGVRPCTASEGESHETVRVTAARSSDVALVSPAGRGAQFRFKPGERNPRSNHYHCGHCGFSWTNALKVCNHWVEKHGMARDEAVSVMAAQNPDVSLDKRARRGPQLKRKPGEYNPKFKLYHCGHCSRQSSSEQVIRNHWVEKHGMSTEEAARVMTAQNPAIALDAPRRVRRVKSRDAADRRWRYQPGERSPKSNAYHCGHCGFRSRYEDKVQDHWVEKHGLSSDEALRVMAARAKESRAGPTDSNHNPQRLACAHCAFTTLSRDSMIYHCAEKHGLAADGMAPVPGTAPTANDYDAPFAAAGVADDGLVGPQRGDERDRPINSSAGHALNDAAIHSTTAADSDSLFLPNGTR